MSINFTDLTKIAEKPGGKNTDSINGFYKDKENREYFIKKPKDKKELFTELLAGLFIQELFQRNLIDEKYKESFICADVIETSDGYALIQDSKKFTELFKLIGTGEVERSVALESWNGPAYYQQIGNFENIWGLTPIIMVSILIGDNSVHSGNVAVLESDSQNNQFCRIDWGAAFRDFMDAKDIWNPPELQRTLSHKWITKQYLHNYSKIPGFYYRVGQRAKSLKEKLGNDQNQIKNSLKELMATALKKIPERMLGDSDWGELYKYFRLSQETGVTHQGRKKTIAENFSDIMSARLEQISSVEKPNTSAPLYASTDANYTHSESDDKPAQNLTFLHDLQDDYLLANQLQKLSVLEREVPELKGQIKALNKELEGLKRKYKALAIKYNKAQETIVQESTIQDEVNKTLFSTNLALEQAKQTLQTRLYEYENKSREFTAKVEILEKEKATLLASLNESKSESDGLTTKIKELEVENKALQEQLKAFEAASNERGTVYLEETKKLQSQLSLEAKANPIRFQIQKIREKSAKESSKTIKKITQELAEQIETNLENFINGGESESYTLEQFQQESLQQIEQASQKLSNYPDWRSCLKNLGVCILLLGVGALVVGAINYAENGSFLLFNKKSGTQKLFDDAIENVNNLKNAP